MCPRHVADGTSRCPGCGAANGAIEFCFQCGRYPCERYTNIGTVDSFVSYRRVKENLEKTGNDLEQYLIELTEREKILQVLLEKYNDGKRKGFFCLAVNDLSIDGLRRVLNTIERDEAFAALEKKEQIDRIVALLEKEAVESGITLKLRK